MEITRIEGALTMAWTSPPELVSAIAKLNRLEFRGRGQELRPRRANKARQHLVDLIDLETGEILDELPSEKVMRMIAELAQEREGTEE